MQFIICDCGTELPFSERDLSAAAGKPFTCPICGRTRKLPLANVFTPSAHPVRPSELISDGRTRSRQVTIVATILVTLLLFFAGSAHGIRFAGILIACAAALLLLVRVVQCGSPAALVTSGIALLGGLALLSGHWSIRAALVALVAGILLQQTLERHSQSDVRDTPSDQWRLELREEEQP